MKILIVRLGSLGDILQSTSILPPLYSAYPTASIDWLVYPYASPILDRNPYISRRIHWGGKSPLRQLGTWLALKYQRYDMVIVLHRHPMLHRYVASLGISKRIGWVNPGSKSSSLTVSVDFELSKSRVQRHHDILLAAGLMSSRVQRATNLPVYDTVEPLPDELEGRRYICIAPGGGRNPASDMPTRRWQGYEALAETLSQRDDIDAIVLLGDQADAVMQAQWLKPQAEYLINGMGRYSIPAVAKVLQQSQGFVGNDSMLLYLALSQKTPSLGIFGPTSAKICLPEGEGIRGLQSGVSCSPCYDPIDHKNSLAFNCPYETRCMAELSVRQVAKEFESLLAHAEARKDAI